MCGPLTSGRQLLFFKAIGQIAQNIMVICKISDLMAVSQYFQSTRTLLIIILILFLFTRQKLSYSYNPFPQLLASHSLKNDSDFK